MWARSCPELKDIDFIHLGLLRCISVVDSGRHFLQTNEQIYGQLLPHSKFYSKKNWRADIAKIDTQIIHVFALYTPEARDLRQLIAFLKITNELDRTVNTSRSFIRDFPYVLSKEIDQYFILEYAIPLQKTCVVSVESALALFSIDDKSEVAELYKTVVIEEEKNDEFYKIIEKSLLKKISNDIQLSNEYQAVMFTLRRLEKIADRALNIASLMHFAKVGGDINRVK
ncbi:phosphate transport system protein [Bathymodiolus japonicus methanotrophic gill symbiont]|nr:phosphate transport system protein [Bathymodiolus japonicus methanotrophic gill symbiont]